MGCVYCVGCVWRRLHPWRLLRLSGLVRCSGERGGEGATGNWFVGFIWDLNVELSLGVVPRRAAHSP